MNVLPALSLAALPQRPVRPLAALRLLPGPEGLAGAGLDLAALDDQSLVMVAQGDGQQRDAAFDELVRRHAPRLHAVAARLVGREEAYDIVQEAFLNAYRALASFRNDALFSTWMHRIVLNCCYATLRRHPESNNDLELTLEPAEERDHYDLQHTAERRDLASALEAALAQIKTEFRETFVLVEYGELDYAEVAGILGIAVGTVKSRMNRAREALRSILERLGYRP
jgi:RNA polymerase sigma-70 factor, ECF subfamily